MNWKLISLLSILILLPTAVLASSSNYQAIVSESGRAFVLVELLGEGTTNLPLPLDVPSPSVEGALYIQAENGIDVFVGSTKRGIIIYESDLYSSKIGEFWELDFEVGGDQINFVLSLPRNADIITTNPPGLIEQKEEVTQISWDIAPSIKKVSVQYKLDPNKIIDFELPIDEIEKVPEGGKQSIVIVGLSLITILLFLAVGFLYLQKFSIIGDKLSQLSGSSKKAKSLVKLGEEQIEKEKETGLSKEKKNIINTLTDNESKIVNAILKHDGVIKRNNLEHETEIAKSSLAAALNNLEKRNIVHINKTRTVHTVELTDWFKSL